MRRATFIALMFLCRGACAEECADARAAEMSTDSLRTWTSVAAAFKQFSGCDDGVVAEGFSEGIARLMADHWAQLPQLAHLTPSNPGLESFVLKHLDETINLADAKKIATLAHDSCPKDTQSLCTKILGKLGFVQGGTTWRNLTNAWSSRDS